MAVTPPPPAPESMAGGRSAGGEVGLRVGRSGLDLGGLAAGRSRCGSGRRSQSKASSSKQIRDGDEGRGKGVRNCRGRERRGEERRGRRELVGAASKALARRRLALLTPPPATISSLLPLSLAYYGSLM